MNKVNTRIAIFFLVATVLCVQSISAYNLEGIIYDYNGEKLVDAMVKLLDSRRFEKGKDFTNGAGEYSIRGLAAGSYTMQITKMGMDKVEYEVFVGGTYYESTKYKDIHLDEIIRFESVSKAEMNGLYILDEKTIPQGAFNHYRKGLKKLEKNDLEDALKEFNVAIRKYKNFARCYTHVGDIYTKLKKYDQAEASYLKAIELNSNDPLAFTGLGALYCVQEKWKKASEQLAQAVKLDPARAQNHLLLGKANYYLGNEVEAEKSLVQGLMIRPKHSEDARILLANLFIKQDRLTDAKSMLSSYLRENPFATNKKEIKKRISELENKIQLYQLPPME